MEAGSLQFHLLKNLSKGRMPAPNLPIYFEQIAVWFPAGKQRRGWFSRPFGLGNPIVTDSWEERVSQVLQLFSIPKIMPYESYSPATLTRSGPAMKSVNQTQGLAAPNQPSQRRRI